MARRQGGVASRAERTIAGVPARIMFPRLMLVVITLGLVCFGLVMLYSASSVESMAENEGDAAYYVVRQFGFALAGLVGAVLIARIGYHRFWEWRGALLALCLLMLAAVFPFEPVNGARRWIYIGSFTLQSSEFVKLALVVFAAGLLEEYYNQGLYDWQTLGRRGALYLAAPVGLVVIEPDIGTTIVAFCMVLSLFVVCGATWVRPLVVGLGVCGVVAGMIIPHARLRILAMLDPWGDAMDKSFQLTRGFMAFGSGGVFGKGLGMSSLKYSYLPEAHNDVIFAIVGEELGLVGCLLVVAAFAAFAYFGLTIARNAPDLTGRLVATGCTALIVGQFFLNVLGVMGWFPQSGKPLPFLSYGGSSICASVMIVGLIVSVSMESSLPETVHDARRRAMSLAEDEPTGVGSPRPRGTVGGAGDALPGGASASRLGGGLRLVQGGAARDSGAPAARVSRGPNGRRRIDLGPDPSERLRGDSGPRVRECEPRGDRGGRRR